MHMWWCGGGAEPQAMLHLIPPVRKQDPLSKWIGVFNLNIKLLLFNFHFWIDKNYKKKSQIGHKSSQKDRNVKSIQIFDAVPETESGGSYW